MFLKQNMPKQLLVGALLWVFGCTPPDGQVQEPAPSVTQAGTTDITSPSSVEPEDPVPAAPFATVEFPPRLAKALTGSAFLQKTKHLSIRAREDRILAELMNGNMPSFLRQRLPVRMSKRFPDGAWHSAWIWVLPDYLAIGSDEDFVRIPMTPVTAQQLADRYGCFIVTTAMVNAIYRQAAIKLKPIPMKPGRQMRSNRYFARHQGLIEAKIQKTDHGLLLAGHKKDVVITNRLVGHPLRVAIYGWHEDPWSPIQPLSIWHRKTYADYSHGVRLVYKDMIVDGQTRAVDQVMQDPTLSLLLSDEGPVQQTRITLDGLVWAKDEMVAL